MLAYYVEWHMRETLRPMLFDDEYIDLSRALAGSQGAAFRLGESQGHDQAWQGRLAGP